MQVRGPRVAGLLLEEDVTGLRAVEIVEEVGLITCERRYWPKGQTPHWAKCTGDLAPATSTWKRKR